MTNIRFRDLPDVTAKLPYYFHPERRDRIRFNVEMSRLEEAERIFQRRHRVRLYDRRSSRESKKGQKAFAVQHTPGLRDIIAINVGFLTFLTFFTIRTNVSVAPTSRSMMIG